MERKFITIRREKTKKESKIYKNSTEKDRIRRNAIHLKNSISDK